MEPKIMTHEARRARRKTIADAVKSGVTTRRAATKFKVTLTTVRDACREHDVEIPTSESTVIRHELCLRLVAQLCAGDLPLAEIARHPMITVSKTYVGRILKRAIRLGIPVHKRYEN